MLTIAKVRCWITSSSVQTRHVYRGRAVVLVLTKCAIACWVRTFANSSASIANTVLAVQILGADEFPLGRVDKVAKKAMKGSPTNTLPVRAAEASVRATDVVAASYCFTSAPTNCGVFWAFAE